MNIDKNENILNFKDPSRCNSACTKASICNKSLSPIEDKERTLGLVNELSCEVSNQEIRNKVITKRKSKKEIAEAVDKLNEDIRLLNLKAMHYEGEMKIIDRENKDLIEILIGVKDNLENRNKESRCENCGIF